MCPETPDLLQTRQLKAISRRYAALGAADFRTEPGDAKSTFNTVVVGGYVPRPNTDGVARRAGWPSPFTRVGPGVADAPVPSFSAGAGDCSDTYQWKPGLGVWTSNKTGDWEDAIGTSHAAPIVAREAALLLRDLQRYCPPGVQPFASTAKAFLHLVARPEAPRADLTAAARTLAKRTLGHGRPSATRLGAPSANTAVFLWQGTLESPGHAARVRVPVPREWLKDASAPQVRVVCAWNTPTGAGAPEVWACRKVNVQLRPSLDGVLSVEEGTPAVRTRSSIRSTTWASTT